MDDARWSGSDKVRSASEKKAMGAHKLGPLKKAAIPLGQKIGKLTVIAIAPYSSPSGKPGGWQPIVRCDCGVVYQMAGSNLKNGKTQNCVRCGNEKRGYKHIIASKADRLRLLGRISAQEKRCYDRGNKNYGSYGALGITVYGPWREDHGLYLRYLKTLPGWNDPSLELDRIDCSEGYKPGNLRFTTKSLNQKNRRNLQQQYREIKNLEHCAVDTLAKLRESNKKLEISRKLNREKDRQIEDLLAIIFEHGIDLEYLE